MSDEKHEKQIIPVRMTLNDTLKILDDIRDRIVMGDSPEGQFAWRVPDVDEIAVYDIRALYRVGDVQDDNGVRVVGTWE